MIVHNVKGRISASAHDLRGAGQNFFVVAEDVPLNRTEIGYLGNSARSPFALGISKTKCDIGGISVGVFDHSALLGSQGRALDRPVIFPDAPQNVPASGCNYYLDRYSAFVADVQVLSSRA